MTINVLKMMMMMMAITGATLALTGCGKNKTEDPKSTVEHTQDDGHDHSAHDEHKGHKH